MDQRGQTKFGEFVDTLTLLGDHQHLKRERAYLRLQNMLQETDLETQAEREVIALAFFKQMFNSARWEDRFGAIQGSLAFIQQQGAKSATVEEYMWGYIIKDRFTKLLVDDEFRVRNQTAVLLKTVVASD